MEGTVASADASVTGSRMERESGTGWRSEATPVPRAAPETGAEVWRYRQGRVRTRTGTLVGRERLFARQEKRIQLSCHRLRSELANDAAVAGWL